MTNLKWVGMAFGVALAAAVINPCSGANSESNHATVGAITIRFASVDFTPGKSLHAYGGISATSDQYDFNGSEITVTYGKSGLPAEAVVIGNPAQNKQVTGKVKGADGVFETILADRAVYTPVRSRPKGGTVVFTGHVSMIVASPLNLAEPATLTVTSATVELGLAPTYPKIHGENGHIIATPL